MNEVWKDSITLAGTHQVSSEGRIRRVTSVVNSSFNATRTISERILSHEPNDGGYKRINLLRDGKIKGFLVHRLVAEVFVSNPRNLPFVNHIDGNKINNHPSNLEWCTHQENMRHAVNTGLNGGLKPVLAIRDAMGFWFPSSAEASRSLGVSKPCICAALKHKGQTTAGGYRWEYAAGDGLVLESRGEYAKLQREAA